MEVLDFLQRDFPQYPWSLRSLDRRLRHFEINYNDANVKVDEVVEAVQKELEGPGKLLGYRAMHKKIRLEHNLNVTRDEVYNVMYHLDPEGLESRGGVGAKKVRRKAGNFTSRGPNWVHSLDGHDKLMGYQNSTFPLAIYGCLDTASRKLLWLRVWTTNSDPKLIGRWYLEYLCETKVMSAMMRLDKGTETGTMATMHAFLRRHHNDMDPEDTVLYGPSTSNQVCFYRTLTAGTVMAWICNLNAWQCGTELTGLHTVCSHFFTTFLDSPNKSTCLYTWREIHLCALTLGLHKRVYLCRLRDGGKNSMKGWKDTSRNTWTG